MLVFDRPWLLFASVLALAPLAAGCDVECLSARCIGSTASGGSGGTTMSGGSGGASSGGTDTGGTSSGGTGTGGSTTGTGGEGPCAVLSISPAPGSKDFAVNGEITIHYSVPVAPGSVSAAVTLTDAAGAAAPIDIAQPDPSTVSIHGKPRLRIWEKYTLTIGPGVTSAGGAACPGESQSFSTGGPVSEGQPLLPAAVSSMTVLGNKALGVSSQYRGIQSYDLAGNPIALTDALRVPETVRSLVLAGNSLAFAPAGYDGVVRFQQSPLERVDTFDTSGFAWDVAPFSRDGKWYVAVADGAAGLHLLAAGDGGVGAMTDLGAVKAATGSITRVEASDDGSLIVVGNGADVFLLTSATPADPGSFAAASDIPVGHADLRLDKAHLYIAEGGNGLSHYDVSAPAAPVKKGAACAPGGACDSVTSLFPAGGEVLAVIAARKAARFTVDAASGALALSSTYASDSPVHGVAASGAQALLATEEGLVVFAKDAAEAAPVWKDYRGFGVTADALRIGNEVYVASGMLGLLTFDWPEGGTPKRVDQDLSPGTKLDYAAIALAAAGNGGPLVLGDARGGVTTYSLATPSNPSPLGSTPKTDIAGHTVIDGSTAYVCDASIGVLIIDLSAPPPNVLGTLAMPDPKIVCFDILLANKHLYVSGGTGPIPNSAGFLGIADVSTPAAPKWGPTGSFPEVDNLSSIAFTSGRFLGVTTRSDAAALDGYARRLVVIDTPEQAPWTISWTSEDIGARRVVAKGGYAFVPSASFGLRVYRFDALGIPVLLGVVPTAGIASSIHLEDSAAMVISGEGGVERFLTGALPAEK
jgi:hypothetical protein